MSENDQQVRPSQLINQTTKKTLHVLFAWIFVLGGIYVSYFIFDWGILKTLGAMFFVFVGFNYSETATLLNVGSQL